MMRVLAGPIALLLMASCAESSQETSRGDAGDGMSGAGTSGAATGGAGIGGDGMGGNTSGAAGVGATLVGGAGGAATSGAAGTATSGAAGAAAGGAAGTAAAGAAAGGAAGAAAGAGGGAAGGTAGQGPDCRSLGCPTGEYCRVAELYVCPRGAGTRYSGRCVPFEIDCQGAASCDCVSNTCTPARCTEEGGAVEVVCWEGCWG